MFAKFYSFLCSIVQNHVGGNINVAPVHQSVSEFRQVEDEDVSFEDAAPNTLASDFNDSQQQHEYTATSNETHEDEETKSAVLYTVQYGNSEDAQQNVTHEDSQGLFVMQVLFILCNINILVLTILTLVSALLETYGLIKAAITISMSDYE